MFVWGILAFLGECFGFFGMFAGGFCLIFLEGLGLVFFCLGFLVGLVDFVVFLLFLLGFFEEGFFVLWGFLGVLFCWFDC